MTDRSYDAVSLRSAWRSLGHRLAVAGGCVAALVSLLNHAPVLNASLRGVVAYAAVLIVARLGLFALQYSLRLERTAEVEDENANPNP